MSDRAYSFSNEEEGYVSDESKESDGRRTRRISRFDSFIEVAGMELVHTKG